MQLLYNITDTFTIYNREKFLPLELGEIKILDTNDLLKYCLNNKNYIEEYQRKNKLFKLSGK